jgi:hypothetical protein
MSNDVNGATAAPAEQPLQVTVDDIVGILIHNANQAATVLGMNGINTDFAKLDAHLIRMRELTHIAYHRIAAIRQQAEAGASQPN